MTVDADHRVRVGSVVFDVHDVERMSRFWIGVLGYAWRDPPDVDGGVLTDPRRRGPNVAVSRTEEPHPDGYRIHLDLYTDEPEREVERILALGATLHRAREAGEDFAVLADPEGNLFCVVDKRPAPSSSR